MNYKLQSNGASVLPDSDGRQPFVEWLAGLADRQARARIQARLAVVAAGSLGDVEPAGEGVLELRINWGPGYRVYCARVGDVVILLDGGDKRTQHEDIKNAKTKFDDFKRRQCKAPQAR